MECLKVWHDVTVCNLQGIRGQKGAKGEPGTRGTMVRAYLSSQGSGLQSSAFVIRPCSVIECSGVLSVSEIWIFSKWRSYYSIIYVCDCIFKGTLGKIGFIGTAGAKGQRGPAGPPGLPGTKGIHGPKVRRSQCSAQMKIWNRKNKTVVIMEMSL